MMEKERQNSLKRKLYIVLDIYNICDFLIPSACGYNQIQIFLFHIQNEVGIGLGREFQLALTGWSNFQHGFEIVVLLG